jgi:hypothetical protein
MPPQYCAFCGKRVSRIYHRDGNKYIKMPFFYCANEELLLLEEYAVNDVDVNYYLRKACGHKPFVTLDIRRNVSTDQRLRNVFSSSEKAIIEDKEVSS